MRKTTFTKDQLAKYGVTNERQLKIYNESYNEFLATEGIEPVEIECSEGFHTNEMTADDMAYIQSIREQHETKVTGVYENKARAERLKKLLNDESLTPEDKAYLQSFIK